MAYKTLALLSALAAAAATPALAETRSYDLSGFTAVKASAGVEVDIAAGGGYSVQAEGSQKALEDLDIRVRDGALIIGRKPGRGVNWGRSQRVTVNVALPQLDKLDVSSGVSATARGVQSQNVSIDASSGASARVSGSCGAVNVEASSGASLNASDLRCERANVKASSGASARVFASQALDANASSGASVHVAGGPQSTNINRSSGGSVTIAK